VKLLADDSLVHKFEEAKLILDENGVLIIENALSSDFIDKCQSFVEKNLEENGRRYFTVSDITELPNSPFVALQHCDEINSLINYLVSSADIVQRDGDYNQGKNLRVIAGEGTVEQSMKFHFDSSILTMLVPIIIPEGPSHLSGDLIAFPNIRPFTSSVLANLTNKFRFQNRLSRWYMAQQAARGRYADYTVKLRPGSLYFFWGFRTLHANLGCDVNNVRATALFFFGNPQPSDSLMRIVKARRYRAEQRILQGPPR
jgi:hypothetical protein